ncbi:MAG: oxygen-dependent coproporphyrinogen oxidase [Myxococcota bacterium]|nr:oxygen-dependent coproporphyrinogen oxidase [Myxococcota bacterium]
MRDRTRHHVEALQDTICAVLERLDGAATFREELWTRDAGGGGRTRVLEGGDVFEKAGVNTSCVFGVVPAALESEMPGEAPEFYATGVSLVLHPVNPHVPTVHANYRYIERGKVSWFGGGADLTPYVLYPEDAQHFHRVHAEVCDRTDPAYYPRFKRWCDEYFRNHHRGEARGIGGVFFDHVRVDTTEDQDRLFQWWSDMGETFVPAYEPIVERRMGLEYDDELRQWQLQRRGRYVEFNLIHDRGTAFGLKTGGRIESILMSLPPLVRWDHVVGVDPESPEARLLEVLKHPREWR